MWLRYCALFAALLAVVVYLALQQYSTLLNEEDFIVNTPEQPTLDSTIKQIQFDVFNVSSPLEPLLPPKNLNHVYEVKELSGKNLEETLRSVVENRLPYVITDSVASKWKALKWNIWDLATSSKWPILKNVLSINSDSSLFVTETERDLGGMLSSISSISARKSPDLISEMYFADFLNDVRSSGNKLFYSTNYRVLEGLAKVRMSNSLSSACIMHSFLL